MNWIIGANQQNGWSWWHSPLRRVHENEMLKESKFMNQFIILPRQQIYIIGQFEIFWFVFVDSSMVWWQSAETLWRPKEVPTQWFTIYSTVDIRVYSGLHIFKSHANGEYPVYSQCLIPWNVFEI